MSNKYSTEKKNVCRLINVNTICHCGFKCGVFLACFVRNGSFYLCMLLTNSKRDSTLEELENMLKNKRPVELQIHNACTIFPNHVRYLIRYRGNKYVKVIFMFLIMS